ncbi:MAG: DUF3054 domain-containing protein [Mycobacterium sp.]|nr:DUF3054 domain-containing protein [Mycobacterium sp.]
MPNPRERATAALAALAADIACLVVFATIGRRTHAEGLSLVGIADTAWPFVAGAAVGWLLVRGWRRPTAIAPTGVTVWVCTVVVAMVLRRVTGEGTALSFVVVASLVTGTLMLGWRAAARRWARSDA